MSDFSGFESPCWMNDFNDIYIVEVPVTSPICYKENIMARIAEIVGGCYAFGSIGKWNDHLLGQ